MSKKNQEIALIEQRNLCYKFEWQKGFLKIKTSKTKFSNIDPFGATYKVYNDGSHFVAIRKIESLAKPIKERVVTDKDRYFDEQYLQAVKSGLTHNKLRKHLKDVMLEQYPLIDNVNEFIDKHIKGKIHNFYSRVKRFKRKVNLNLWNRFVTITYDDKKHTEDSFRTKLKKCLSNLHSRRGWNYMGVFEKGEDNDRLHFHAFMYIPSNEMVGILEERKDYSTKLHKIQTTLSNSFFEEKFGRNDFEELTTFELKNGSAISYITKYLFKSNEKICYSRGIPSELELYIRNEDIASTYEDFVVKYVLFDDCIDSNNIYIPYKAPKLKQGSIFEFQQCG